MEPATPGWSQGLYLSQVHPQVLFSNPKYQMHPQSVYLLYPKELGEKKGEAMRASGKLKTRPCSVTGSTHEDLIEYQVSSEMSTEAQTSKLDNTTASAKVADEDAMEMLKAQTWERQASPPITNHSVLYIYMYVYVYVCVCVYIHVHVHTHDMVCICTCTLYFVFLVLAWCGHSTCTYQYMCIATYVPNYIT